jgi:hypothetical protein
MTRGVRDKQRRAKADGRERLCNPLIEHAGLAVENRQGHVAM